jgi:hypothetical protein
LGSTRTTRRLDHALHVRQRALGVVGQDHHTGLGEPCLEVGQLGLQRRRGRCLLEVDAHHLLLAAHHAQLHGGVQGRIGGEPGIDALLRQQARETRAGLVAPHHREQPYLRAQRSGIARHVGGAPGPLLHARDAHHRNRRFG